MERTKWTDDLLDARMGSIDKQQDRLFQEIQILRTEVHREISGVRAELATFRQQVIMAHRRPCGEPRRHARRGCDSAFGALAVNQPAVRRPGGFHDRFRERRVRVDDAGDL